MSKKFENFDSFSEIRLPKSLQNVPRCDFCEKPLPKRHVVHVNQCQDTATHKFCGKVCKENWCHAQRNAK
ncbi:hypothetical protein NEF87_002881 [Candidatus Lokiarchaeum ossiferum]|uniref:TRASH domain-containing protein n=1 Tax=Candidatus Lokiarchaeum ossiferum TaxID=2951803 RepID=A0ABY6HT58_9ARCH|nr:hypothetical protein NEF87_002881 [Candidatus Lokiarchaeum sp. B-35]